MSEDIEDTTQDQEPEALSSEELEAVDISDLQLEVDDKQKQKAKKEAKKTAKKIRTPKELRRSKIKKIVIAVVVGVSVMVGLFAVPNTRWPILNFIGFRSSVLVTVQVQSTKKPIFNATVKLENNQSTTTDTFGHARFEKVRLGSHTLTAQKAGYGDTSFVFTNSFGTTKPSVAMKIIGIQLNFDVKNWLSEQPISGANLSYEKSTAQTDKTGRASLIISPTDKKTIDVVVSAPGFLTKTLTTDTSVESSEVSLVSAQKDYFISKRDGTFDIFSSNLDGSEQTKIIQATGKEDESLLQFTINPNNKQAVLVATRDGKIQNGRLVAGVYSLNLEQASLKKFDEGSDIQILDWSDTTIVYTKSDANLLYNDPALSRVMSYNLSTQKLTELRQANYFSVSLVAQGKVFYMPNNPYGTIDDAVLTSVDVKGGSKKTYLEGRQIGYATRAGYNTLQVQDTSGANFEIQLSNEAVKAIDTRPSNSYSFSISQNNQQAVWSDRRDGQGALIIRDLKTNQESVVSKTAGLTSPVRYISDDLVVVRVATSQETADYVVSLNSKKITKIVDVLNINSTRQQGL